MVAARRPLHLYELRDALAVETGETSWDPKRLANDMLRSLDCCGSLVVMDEEHSTVQFAHYSVMQHLTNTSGLVPLDLHAYFSPLETADTQLGYICITYLNLDVFRADLVSTRVDSQSAAVNYPAAIVNGMLPSFGSNHKLLKLYLKTKSEYRINVCHQMEAATSLYDLSHECTRPKHPFLPYVNEHWLYHTRNCNLCDAKIDGLWTCLLEDRTSIIELPWAGFRGEDPSKLLSWLKHNNHGLILSWAVEKFCYTTENAEVYGLKLHYGLAPGTQLIPQVVAMRKTFRFSVKTLQIALTCALLLCKKSLMESLLEMGATAKKDILPLVVATDALGEQRLQLVRKLLDIRGHVVIEAWSSQGTALQVACSRNASVIGELDMVRLLLKKGADVNTQSRHRGWPITPLQIASKAGKVSLVRLLLENGAEVNAQGGKNGTALQAALISPRFKVKGVGAVPVLFEYGADIHACVNPDADKSSDGPETTRTATALQAAAYGGRYELVKLVLDKGADVNERAGRWDTALLVAAADGFKDIVQLLLDAGAVPDAEGGTAFGTAWQAATSNRHKDIVRLLEKAIKDYHLKQIRSNDGQPNPTA